MKSTLVIPSILLFTMLSISGFLNATIFIQGYIYDASTDSIIVNANVDGVCINAVGSFHTMTNGQGYYKVEQDTLDPLPEGTWQVTASKNGYQSQMKNEHLPNPFRYVNFYLMPNDE